jgi:hypothetical protein
VLIHESIPPIPAWIGREYLYDMAPERVGEFDRCTVFGVSSYARHALTFQVMVSDGSLFSYVPVIALRARETEGAPWLSMVDLLYRDCPSERIAVTVYEYLRGEHVDCYFRNRDLWQGGEYLCSIDWPDDNEQAHLIRLDSGQFAALPNHKLKFRGGDRSFKPYRKLRQTWRRDGVR